MVKFFYNFFHWQNHIRPLSDQCTVREFEIEMSLSTVYIKKFKCLWTLQVIDRYFHDDTLWVLVWPILLVANDSFGNR